LLCFFGFFLWRIEFSLQNNAWYSSYQSWQVCVASESIDDCGVSPTKHLETWVWYGFHFFLSSQGLILTLTWGTQLENVTLWYSLLKDKESKKENTIVSMNGESGSKGRSVSKGGGLTKTNFQHLVAIPPSKSDQNQISGEQVEMVDNLSCRTLDSKISSGALDTGTTNMDTKDSLNLDPVPVSNIDRTTSMTSISNVDLGTNIDRTTSMTTISNDTIITNNTDIPITNLEDQGKNQ